MKIDEDEYGAWVENPVTQAVFKELLSLAEHRKQIWIDQSWNAGKCEPAALAMLRGQAEAFAFLPNADHAKLFGDEE